MEKEVINYLNSLINDNTTKKELDIIEFIKKCVKEHKPAEKKNSELEAYISELYDKFYKIYVRKGSKEQGRKTFRKKLIKLKTKELILEKARKIVKVYYSHLNIWQENETEKKYIPLVSSWLNANVPE